MRIPEYATLAQINQCLIQCANGISEISTKVAEYKADASLKQSIYKQKLARAKVLNMDAKNATATLALAETDGEVIAAQDNHEQASALYTIAMGEMDALQTTFIALRKIVEIKRLESTGGGYTE